VNRNQWVIPIVSIERHAGDARPVVSGTFSICVVIAELSRDGGSADGCNIATTDDSNLTYNAAY